MIKRVLVKRSVLGVLILAGWTSVAPLALALPASAGAQDDNPHQIYCVSNDLRNNRVFHSAVFAGNYQRASDYGLAFRGHVAARWGPMGGADGAQCFYEATRAEATNAQNMRAAEHQNRRYNVIWTRWAG